MKMGNICSLCGREGKTHVHHKNGNHEDNAVNNRIVLCPRCHHQQHNELPGRKPRSEITFEVPPRVPLAVVKAEYARCFPRYER